MLFTSLTFLYAFLPATVLLYFVIPNRHWRNGVLLIASLIFYSWGEPIYIVLMITASLVAYAGGLLISQCGTSLPTQLKKPIFILTVVILLSNLFVFKYLNFVCTIFGAESPEVSLPIGISFYTFQILSYVADLYLGKIGVQKNPAYLTLYVSFFPQLIAGPIVRYQTIEDEILNRHENFADFTEGLRRFMLGLGKKVLISNYVAIVADSVYGFENPGTSALWVAALAYTLEIYFDFSGYSDMAIGLGRMFGFHFPENFDYPYLSCSVTEFWRRWHISLSSWFRDYVYIPLGGNRRGTPRTLCNLLVVWGLTGLWHGASWNFVLWGLYYAAFLILEKYVLKSRLEKLPCAFRWLITFVIVTIGWVIFNLTEWPELAAALKGMFVYTPTNWFSIVSDNADFLFAILFLPVGLLLSFPICRPFFKREGRIATVLQNFACLVIFFFSIVCLISSVYNPFIYFRF